MLPKFHTVYDPMCDSDMIKYKLIILWCIKTTKCPTYLFFSNYVCMLHVKNIGIFNFILFSP
jgi:hypothetical protein